MTTASPMYNQDLLMCRPEFFEIAYQINPYMDPAGTQPDPAILKHEYDALVAAHRATGRTVQFIEPAPGLPDMTFTANHALVRGKKAVLGQLPPERAGEVATTRAWLEGHGYEVVECPYRFSGQGDALPTGAGALIKGRQWRSDPHSDAFVADFLGYDIIPIHTITNSWYDCDLAVAILAPGVIAVCSDVLDEASQQTLRARDDLEIIPVTLAEAQQFALNLVSDGHTVTLPTGAPHLEAELRRRGFAVVPLAITQLMLGGGGIRCTTLALDAQ